MSRVGKKQITIPAGVEVRQEGEKVSVRGTRGTLTRHFKPVVTIAIEGGAINLKPVRHDMDTQALWGTYASHLLNMIEGVTTGYTKKLIIEGVGYRAAVSGQKLVLNLGLSHQVEVAIPAEITVAVEKGVVTISGSDKELVGGFAAKIRALKKPEPYKGKGIRYENEVVRRKEGKRVVA